MPMNSGSVFGATREERSARGKNQHPEDAQFMEAVGHLPPCAGIALGADRLLALLLGESMARVRHGAVVPDTPKAGSH